MSVSNTSLCFTCVLLWYWTQWQFNLCVYLGSKNRVTRNTGWVLFVGTAVCIPVVRSDLFVLKRALAYLLYRYMKQIF